MNSKQCKVPAKSAATDIKNAVQQARPNDDCETIMKPPTNEEVEEAVKEINPDKNSMNSRG